MPVPQTQAVWLEYVRLWCLDCCGSSRKAVRECNKKDCRWHDCRLEPVQLTLFDKGFRDIYYQDIRGILLEMEGEFTAEDVKKRYKEKFNDSNGPVHPNWIGVAMQMHAEDVGAVFIGTRKSKDKKRRGGYVGVWYRNAQNIKVAV